MIPVLDKDHDEYSHDELSRLEGWLDDYWQKSRSFETESINDLEKHLWLANAAAATISIGYLQAADQASLWQILGSWSFVVGILFLVGLKFVSSWAASRERSRFEAARARFYRGETKDSAFVEIRDNKHLLLKNIYLALQYGAGIAFLAGLVLTLVGVASAA
jgi:hypothetical protein